jgi:hypothetical protein
VVSADSARHGLLSEDTQSDQLMMAAMRDVFSADGATVADLVDMTKLSRPSVYRSRARLLESGRLWSNSSRRLFLRTNEDADGG